MDQDQQIIAQAQAFSDQIFEFAENSHLPAAVVVGALASALLNAFEVCIDKDPDVTRRMISDIRDELTFMLTGEKAHHVN